MPYSRQNWERPKDIKEDDPQDHDEMAKYETSYDAGGEASESDRGKKRQKPDDEEGVAHQPTWKTFSQPSGNVEINVDGNRIERTDVMTIQQPPDFISAINQALWLIIEEPIPDSFYMPWMRPATRLSVELESQFQSNQGLRECQLQHKNAKGQTSTSYYEHDLRCLPWVQRKFTDQSRTEIASEKEIHRVTLS